MCVPFNCSACPPHVLLEFYLSSPNILFTLFQLNLLLDLKIIQGSLLPSFHTLLSTILSQFFSSSLTLHRHLIIYFNTFYHSNYLYYSFISSSFSYLFPSNSYVQILFLYPHFLPLSTFYLLFFTILMPEFQQIF